MSWAFLLLVAAAPSVAFAATVGYAPELLPVLLVLYWGAYPPALYWAGAFLPVRLPRVRGEVYALVLPYLLYWPAARRAGLDLRGAWWAFLKGPGAGVPLAALLGLALSGSFPAFPVTLATLGLALLLERGLRGLRLRSSHRPEGP